MGFSNMTSNKIPTQINKKPKHIKLAGKLVPEKKNGNSLCSECAFNWVQLISFLGHNSCCVVRCNLAAVHTTEKPANN